MSTADKIGLLPGFGWIAGHGFAATLLICWLLTPGLMFLIGLVGESRVLPWKPTQQFLSFFPGDFFLGDMTAGLLVLARRLPAEKQWYNSGWFHLSVLLITLAVAIVMTWSELTSGACPRRAIFSPTKLYHNILLYGGYGYVIVSTLLALLFSAETRGVALVVCLLPGLVWVALLVDDERARESLKQQRLRHAHIPDWRPIWRRS